jgi:GT2 family glycosyltransferase
MVSYLIPPNVKENRIDHRPVLATEQDGKIAVDVQMLSLWKFASGRNLETILAEFHPGEINPDEIRAGLTCLVEAGLLQREPESKSEPRIQKEEISGPLVSVITVAHNSLEWLPACLDSIAVQNYQPIELLIVDNASNDGTQAWVPANYPQANYRRINEVVSFAKAINIGVDAAAGEYFLLLNPDTKLDSAVVAEMVHQAQEHPNCGAVAAKLKLLWAPGFLNGIGNRVGAFSWGVDNALGHLDLGQFDQWTELPSACFAAALIPKPAWEKVGPADEEFPMYYEDSEWSYRARKRGLHIIAATEAVVYHAFGGRIPAEKQDRLSPAKLENVVYGRLRFTFKLLDGYQVKFFLSYLFSDLINIIRYIISLKTDFVSAVLRGYRRYFNDLSEIRSQRKVQLDNQVVPDKSLFALQHDMPETLIWHGLPELSWDLVRNYYLPIIQEGITRPVTEFSGPNRRSKLLIVSHDVIDKKLAGPGMRYLELGRTLSSDIDVTIAVPARSSLDVPQLEIREYHENQPDSLQKIVDSCDIVLISSYLVERFPFLWKSHARIVVDLYDPFVLENLHYYFDEPLKSQQSLNLQSVAITNQLARIGDFFICGNERQRDYWLGVLTSNGRVNPRNYRVDPQLRSLIDVVGVGYPDRPPQPSNLLRGIHPLVPFTAQIVLWGGGIWNWLDPITLIKAWPNVLEKFPSARLVLLGTRHPNPDIPSHKMAEDAQSLAENIGEKDKTIIFFEWLSYQDREALLCEADVGVSLHPVHIETRYSIRTRMLDYIWARLPVVVTDGDITSEWIREYGLGQVVPPQDTRAVEQALISMLDKSKDSWFQKFEAFGDDFQWGEVAAPLRKYCLEGLYAPDRLDRERSTVGKNESGGGWSLNWARVRFIYRSEGWRGLTHRTWRYFQRKIANP